MFQVYIILKYFIHNMISINIRYGGLDHLLETYNSCQNDYSGYFYLIHENSLDLKNFKYFMNKLSEKDCEVLENILHIRENQEKKVAWQKVWPRKSKMVSTSVEVLRQADYPDWKLYSRYNISGVGDLWRKEIIGEKNKENFD